jgi:methylated-DNA-protein-cysteine methyltransferase related protein
MGQRLDSLFRRRVYDAVRLIPHGRVATYGDVSLWCGAPRQARQVGWALHSLPPELAWGAETDLRRLTRPPRGAGAPAPVPWHRVINAQGRVSTHPDDYGTRRQIELLRVEGIAVTEDGSLVAGLEAHRWEPDQAQVDALELPSDYLPTVDPEGSGP